MSIHIKWLNTRYRDQIIRELQVVRERKHLVFCTEVIGVMEAADKERARHGAVAHHWWRRFRPAEHVRRDDSLFASDLYLLEATLIEHLDESDLQLRVAGYRDMLSNLMTEESYAALSSHFLPLEGNGDDASGQSHAHHLLAEARALTSRLYRRYAGVPAVEDIRSSAAISMLLFTALLLVFVALAFQLQWPTRFLLFTGGCGAVGASISTLERLYRIDPKHEPFKTWLAIKSGSLTLNLSPFIGFVFALVLYVLMRADLIGGMLVPNFQCWAGPENGTLGAITLGEQCKAVSPFTELAKLLCWGFLAGWAERMVPDVLNKLVPQAAAGVRTK